MLKGRAIFAGALIAGVLGLAGMWGQGGPSAAFEVVSVKPSLKQRDADPASECRNGRFTSAGFPVSFVVRWTFELPPLLISGMPGWANDWDEAYDIEARAATAVDPRTCRQMVERMLSDRFHLLTHKEQRTMQGYTLVAVDGGQKLEKLARDSGSDGTSINGQPVWDTPDTKGLSMSGLAHVLEGHPRVGMPVNDGTGLRGAYRFRLNFSQRDDDGLASIFSALQALGLKLQSGKIQAPMLVIDRLEHPTAN